MSEICFKNNADVVMGVWIQYAGQELIIVEIGEMRGFILLICLFLYVFRLFKMLPSGKKAMKRKSLILKVNNLSF